MATNTRKLAALLGASGANIADAGTINTAGITNDAINASKIVANAVGTSEVADNVLTATDLAANSVGESELSVDYTAQSVPHIIPGVLQPAVAGKLLDGVTNHSGNYGTAQSDGHSYYYTDIRGSKSIKDPRVGSYFGSQRVKFKSIQKLKQESAAQNTDVYSIDGREWCRVVATNPKGEKVALVNDGAGIYIHLQNTGDFIEITGYFNDFNTLMYCHSNRANDVSVKVNGGTARDNDIIGGKTTIFTPLATPTRYVDCGSVINHGDTNIDSDLGTAPKINTLKIELTNISSEHYMTFGVDLIAHDLSGSGSPNRSNIKIPAQNVVSFGKKFPITETNHHYNPFATKGDGSASTIPSNTTGDSVATGWTGSTSAYWESTLDETNSLGLDAWVSGGNYYRPVNGGRIVKYVDSTGTIKTAVNMMPPEAAAFEGRGTGTCPATGTHNWKTEDEPKFGNKTIGSDLITNGTFASDTAWTKETGVTISSGKVHMQGTSTQSFYQAVSNLVIGREYKATYTISDYAAGGARLYVDGGGGRGYDAANGTFSRSFIATAASHNVGLGGKSGTTDNLKVDNFSLYEIEQPEVQSEEARTFIVSEFGNGAGNSSANVADVSILNTSSNVSYVMDDGLTSLTANTVTMAGGSASFPHTGYINIGSGDSVWTTFIGSGVTLGVTNWDGDNKFIHKVALNLPYGSHTFRVQNSSDTISYIIDGVTVYSAYQLHWAPIDYTFHQPKRPPIPEDAVVLSDYMLMADHVNKNSYSPNQHIGKGVRLLDCSRDFLHDCSSGTMLLNNLSIGDAFPFRNYMNSGSGAKNSSVSAFGTSLGIDSLAAVRNDPQVNGTTITAHTDVSHHIHLDSPVALANNKFAAQAVSGQDGGFFRVEIATPIHTSHHYQYFESPWSQEILGGDRNMEQTNLICSADGKTWDEITRDTSYIGNSVISASRDGGNIATDTNYIFDFLKGRASSYHQNYFYKDFAWSYNKFICLVDGTYNIDFYARGSTDNQRRIGYIFVNTTYELFMETVSQSSEKGHIAGNITINLKRGDWFYIYRDYGDWMGSVLNEARLHVTRV